MSREKAIRLLFLQWTIIAAIGVSMITAQSIAGKYGDDSEIAWNWLLGQFTPGLSILLAAVFSEPSAKWRTAAASRWKWGWAFALGILQGTLLLLVLLVEPLLSITAFDLFSQTQWMLALLQGIAVAAIGAVIFDGR